ncbi:MAG: transaldolase [Nanoarchaeota archaeon]|nr:transaldolase [Nanoarchaeota archaeon]
MKIFLDSADLEEIKKAKSYGILEGVTTNPSLIKKAAKARSVKDLEVYIKEILKVCKGIPVSLEVIGSNYEDMFNEGKLLFKKFNPVAKNVYIKIPINPSLKKGDGKKSDGIKAIKALTKLGIPVNCTLIFTPEQALLAAIAGAKFVSPFAGREDDFIRESAGLKFDKKTHFPVEGLRKGKRILNDNGIYSGIDLIEEIVEIFENKDISCEVLAASLRNPRQVREAALVGADIATIPLDVIESLLDHEKTREGMKGFTKDTIPEYSKIFKKSKNKRK